MWAPEARQRYTWTRRNEGLRLTEPEWALLEPLLPQQVGLTHLRTGCGWSALPNWASPCSTVYEWFRRLPDGGWVERLHHALLMAVRDHQGREASQHSGSSTGRPSR